MNQTLHDLEEQLAKARKMIVLTAPDSSKNQELLEKIAGLEAQIDALKTAPPPSPPPPPPDPLRDAYLGWLMGDVCDVSMSGIDPEAASGKEEDSCLELDAIYTALLTFGANYDEHALAEPDQRERLLQHLQRERHQLSALAQLNTHEHLVLLGDPGSGKSTFVNFVAMCLAGSYLQDPKKNLDLLIAPLPDKEGKDEEEPQRWERRMLLPVRIILRDFALEGLPKPGKPAGVKHLWGFLEKRLKAASLKKFVPTLKETFLEQGGLLLLDGLDEVPEAHERRTQIKDVVEDFAATYRKCRVLVTSRIYAYQKQDWRLQNFEETVLAPFSTGQIRRFVNRWYERLALRHRMNPEDATRRADSLIRAILGSERLSHLAERPLLLTLMASLHAWRGGSLPEDREELYKETVDLLLRRWEAHRSPNPEGQLLSLRELLKLRDDGLKDLRLMMNRLAFEAHAGQSGLQGAANISYEAVAAGLMRIGEARRVNPSLLAEYLRERAGLLVPHGVNIYRFSHRTFQEYLAACYLTEQDDYPENIADFARRDPNRWREVVLLAAAKAARGSARLIWLLLEDLCACETDEPEATAADAWGALLAAQALLETTSLEQISPKNRRKLGPLSNWLVSILTEQRELESGKAFPAVERALAGRLLAELGDPRPGVGVYSPPGRGEGWVTGLPDIEWREIEAGRFGMGDDKAHRVTFTKGFKMSRYPITNAQYQAFVDDGGYTEKWQKLWSEDGLRWKEEEEWEKPRKFSNPHFALSNHPVVGVSWYEAVVFCQWLTQRLRETGDLKEGEIVRLPSEAEWEYAARGEKGHIYPWGEKITPELANYDDTNFGETSAVGCFPRGKSLFSGCEEMAGNVWEWCQDWYHEDYTHAPADGRAQETKGKLNAKVLRGGSWVSTSSNCRCAVRYWDNPNYWYFGYGFRVVVGLPWT